MVVSLMFPRVWCIGVYKSEIISQAMKMVGQEVNTNGAILKAYHRKKIVKRGSIVTVKNFRFKNKCLSTLISGHAVAYATNQKVAGLIPEEILGFFS